MSIIRNPVQTFIRNAIRLVISVILLMLLVLPEFSNMSPEAVMDNMVSGGVKTLLYRQQPDHATSKP